MPTQTVFAIVLQRRTWEVNAIKDVQNQSQCPRTGLDCAKVNVGTQVILSVFTFQDGGGKTFVVTTEKPIRPVAHSQIEPTWVFLLEFAVRKKGMHPKTQPTRVAIVVF